MASQAELRDQARSFLLRFHKAGDALNAQHWIPNLWTPDAELMFPGQPLYKGTNDIIAFFEQQFTLLHSMKHDIVSVAVVDGQMFQEAVITYVVNGDPEKKEVPIKGIAIMKWKPGDEKIGGMRVYLDPTALVERFTIVTEGKAGK